MNALWRLAVLRPELLAAHLSSYAALLQDDGARSLVLVRRRLMGLALAFAGFTVAAALSGVALLLWALTPVVAPHLAWLLVAVPLVPALVGLAAIRGLQKLAPLPLWLACRQQWARDRVVLQRGAQP